MTDDVIAWIRRNYDEVRETVFSPTGVEWLGQRGIEAQPDDEPDKQ